MKSEGIYKVAGRLYKDLKLYRNARETPVEEEKSDGSIKTTLAKIEHEMKQTPATITLTGVDLHIRIIEEKAQLLADLGILKEVFSAVEDLDEEFGTHYMDTLDSLTEGII